MLRNYTKRFTDMGKLISRWCFGFRLKPIFNTAPAACKNTARFKVVKIDQKNNHLANLDP